MEHNGTLCFHADLHGKNHPIDSTSQIPGIDRAYPKIRDSQQNPYIIYNPDQETISLNLCLHKIRKKDCRSVHEIGSSIVSISYGGLTKKHVVNHIGNFPKSWIPSRHHWLTYTKSWSSITTGWRLGHPQDSGNLRHVVKAIINHPPNFTIQMGGKNRSQIGGSWLCFNHIIIHHNE
jgi:hypothetical protein